MGIMYTILHMRRVSHFFAFAFFILGVGAAYIAWATPARASAFTMETTPTYVTGKLGQALQVGQSDVPIYSFSDGVGFSPSAGTIEAWVQPTDWNTGTGYWEILSGVDENGADTYEFRRGKDSNIDVLQFIAYRSDGRYQAWRTQQSFTWTDGTWYHLAVTWSADQSPVVYVNGQPYQLIAAYGETTWTIKGYTDGENYLGQRGNAYVRENHIYNHAGRAAYDEMRVSSRVRTAAEIAASYNAGAGRVLDADAETLWLAHFDNALTILRSEIAEGPSFFSYSTQLRGGFYTTSGDVLGDSRDEIITGTHSGMAPQVRIFDNAGSLKGQFFAYAQTLRHGVTVTACDVNGDGTDEIITGQGQGGWPLVKVFDGNGNVLNNGFFVLDGKFEGGIHLTCGDTNGDGTREIIVGAMRGGGPQVMVYNAEGRALTNFMAYGPSFRGGIMVTAVDADGDGKDEIITGPEVGAAHIQIFQIRKNEIKRLSPGFTAFDSQYRGGVSLAGVDTDGDGTKEIVVGIGGNTSPEVKVYNIREQVQKQAYVFATNFRGGVELSGGDVNNDGIDELLVTPRSTGAPQVRMLSL